ncbi:MAG: flagellar basal body rod protein FlgC [Acidimicrobiales bacterium]
MSLFGVLPIAQSGADAMQTWIDTAAGNVANMNDAAAVGTPTYAQQTPVLTPGPASGGVGQGVRVAGVALGSTAGTVAHEPTSPLANAQGDVLLPQVSLSGQLVGMIEAQQSYQADTFSLARAQTAYTAGLAIGT